MPEDVVDADGEQQAIIELLGENRSNWALRLLGVFFLLGLVVWALLGWVILA